MPLGTVFANPVTYEVPPMKYSAETILKLLLDPTIDTSHVCKTWLVVDVIQLKYPDDVRKDFFGTGSHLFTFKAYFNDGTISVEKCAPGAHGTV